MHGSECFNTIYDKMLRLKHYTAINKKTKITLTHIIYTSVNSDA